MLKTYEDMVNVCLSSDRSVHFLYFFLKLTAMPSGEAGSALFPDQDLRGIESVCTLVFEAHEQVKPGLTFSQLIDKGDISGADWDLVMVFTMRSKTDEPITLAQTQQALLQLRAGILSGDFPPGIPVFDKEGRAREFDRVTPLAGASQHRQ